MYLEDIKRGLRAEIKKRGKMNTCESKYVKYWLPLPSAPKDDK